MAKEIREMDIAIPCYSFGCNKERCDNCGGGLENWKSRCKKKSVKNEEYSLLFGRSVMAITREGSFSSKVFKKQCTKCGTVYGYNKFVLRDVVTYTRGWRNSEWMSLTSETFFLTSYV